MVIVVRRVRSDESLNEAIRAARGDTFVQDAFHVPQNHAGVNEALRETRERGIWRVNQRMEEQNWGEGD